MLETAIQEERSGIPWDVIGGFFALAVLIGAGYFLVM